MLKAIAQAAPSGAVGFDTDAVLTPALAADFVKAGNHFVIRYVSLNTTPQPGDLTAAEAQAIISAGLALMPVQHVLEPGWTPSQALGQLHGNEAVARVKACGFSPGVTGWLDLEGVSARGTAAETIAYCNAWSAAVSGAGFQPGVYVGAQSALTGEQLYDDLTVTRYWHSGSEVPPVKRGYCMTQTIAGKTLDGVAYDGNVIHADREGATPTWMALYTNAAVASAPPPVAPAVVKAAVAATPESHGIWAELAAMLRRHGLMT